ncbi:ABC transporter ATP-binding protein [Mangrovicoccus algicola]|uniref:ABC transporter ATP-binding protein n=1 Tax=Mangrovicoccus algicola TaxID=2771008 RepID=A0A8J6YW87_9RHOB|nr:ABC transporter ATP-binding protein [Mangrovicoccus algicola]MBE3638897.1 ABC transporter ATP-binding protein [Mangrovicoccus algicola]
MTHEGLILSDLARRFSGEAGIGPLGLDIRPGEIVALTGPSGTGKTTVCRMISGLERPDAGEVVLGGRALSALPVQARGVAHMFESYALYSHLSVAQNVAFPLLAPGKPRLGRDALAARVQELLDVAQIGHLGARKPGALSGGQKQRVALCRCLVQDAAVFLLDEPISHLDAKLRNELRGWIRRRQTALGVPTLWSTPDAMEALSVADRVAVMIDGRIAQFAAPEEVYFRPATTEVARLVGDPAMNLVEGRLEARDGGAPGFRGKGIDLALPGDLAARLSGGPRDVVLGLRPSAMSPGGRDASLKVYAWEPFGKHAIITAMLEDTMLRLKTPRLDRFEANQEIGVTIDPAGLVLFDATTRRAL